MIYIGSASFPVIVTTSVTTKMINYMFKILIGDSYKPSFATITGKGTQEIHWMTEILHQLRTK